MTTALGMALLLAACACAPNTPPTHTLSFDADISPIIEIRCQVCHRPGGAGPMPLLTYDDVMHNIVQVRGNVVDKVMPPERVDGTTGEKHPAGLSDAEIAVIVRWMQDGYRQR